MLIKELWTVKERKLGKFFLVCCNDNKIKELFASTINEITASVRCVSTMIAVLNAKLIRLIVAHANENDGEKRKSLTTVPFSF